MPIFIEWLCAIIIIWMSRRDVLRKLICKMPNRSVIEGLGLLIVAYLILYPYLCSALGFEVSIYTIPTVILFLILNKTLWIFIFLFWFGWNLLTILKNLQSNLIKSKQFCEKENSDRPNQ